MDIASPSHWENINTKRKFEKPSSPHGLRAWFGLPPSREIFYRIADRFFKPDSKKTVLEVGCAPARRLMEFSGRYHYMPYGVEYTKAGVEATALQFEKYGIPKKNCFFSDVFDASFQKAQKNKFDAVISYGFIEHFTNVEEVVDAHLNLLKPGGLLLIMIPNLRGIYYPLTRCLAPDLIPKHNLTIMKMETFATLFPSQKVGKLFLDYYGVFNMGMLQGRGKLKSVIVRALQILQVPFNPLLRHCHRFENPLTSPYLLFIGRKPLRNHE